MYMLPRIAEYFKVCYVLRSDVQYNYNGQNMWQVVALLVIHPRGRARISPKITSVAPESLRVDDVICISVTLRRQMRRENPY